MSSFDDKLKQVQDRVNAHIEKNNPYRDHVEDYIPALEAEIAMLHEQQESLDRQIAELTRVLYAQATKY